MTTQTTTTAAGITSPAEIAARLAALDQTLRAAYLEAEALGIAMGAQIGGQPERARDWTQGAYDLDRVRFHIAHCYGITEDIQVPAAAPVTDADLLRAPRQYGA